MENTNVVQLTNETFDTLMHYQGARGYRQGVQDAIKGMRLGVGVALVGLFGAVIVSALVDKYTNKKQTEETSIKEE